MIERHTSVSGCIFKRTNEGSTRLYERIGFRIVATNDFRHVLNGTWRIGHSKRDRAGQARAV